MSTFGSFSGRAAALLEATPLVVGTQKYQSGQWDVGVAGGGWVGVDQLESCGCVQGARQGDRWLYQLAGCRSQSAILVSQSPRPACLAGDHGSGEDGKKKSAWLILLRHSSRASWERVCQNTVNGRSRSQSICSPRWIDGHDRSSDLQLSQGLL